MMTLDELVGVNRTQRILEAVKSCHLQDRWFHPGNGESIQHLRDLRSAHVPVFRTERIDGRINEKLGNRQSLGKSGQRENGGIIFEDVTPKKRPGRTLRLGEVQVAAPQPAAIGPIVDQSRRLMVVNHHHVGFEFQRLGISFNDMGIGLVHVLSQLVIAALQGVQHAGDHHEVLL